MSNATCYATDISLVCSLTDDVGMQKSLLYYTIARDGKLIMSLYSTILNFRVGLLYYLFLLGMPDSVRLKGAF